ncbi:type IV pilin protein [Candidatus Thiothrix sp. Deng01]|uniref:Type IV pilin protein n=1 Tax=Candidatus Thiothrix phosphatis TaxID=3112415 RepID=A0ABU6D1Z1_9GAMM|nr:type IV pilin protein [Candidatus Thiothrix sp. Deng01]MEB4592384.1 type IV pilin protein [Candidatus Thiothrix sp. Deng01]
MKIKKQYQGFTLIELMITVAIIGILSAIAYPNYTAYVQKSRRADAQVALMEITQRQESYFLRNYSYAKDLAQLGYPSISNDGQYTLSETPTPGGCGGVNTSPCNSYVLSATPATSSPQHNDAACQAMTLDNRGAKRGGVDAAHAAADTAQTCWK